MKIDTIITDFSNVSYAGLMKPTLKMLPFLERTLKNTFGDKVTIIHIADASLRHKIDERVEFEKLLNSGRILQVPCECVADHFIIHYAIGNKHALIISNDRFKEYEFPPEVRRRIIKVMFIGNTCILGPRAKNFSLKNIKLDLKEMNKIKSR
ncbi:MAG: NYN domain-containing protein [Promethearchaeota archaeon]